MAYRNPDEPFFHALLTPHRSLGPKGFRILMAVMIAISLGCGLLFLSLGAWPVFGFLGLDLALIYWAFRANYRSGRAMEEIFISRTSLDIRQTSPKGEMVEHRFNPFWARFDVKRHEEIGIISMAIRSQGQELPVGAFLPQPDRERFAIAFSRALSTARNG